MRVATVVMALSRVSRVLVRCRAFRVTHLPKQSSRLFRAMGSALLLGRPENSLSYDVPEGRRAVRIALRENAR